MSSFRFLRRPRYADVAATLALVFAMSGTAYAAVAMVADPNSVDTAAIQAKAVTTPKLANEAVSEAQIAPGAVSEGKLAGGSVTHAKIGSNAVTGGNVANHSLTLSDLAGAGTTGSISFSLSAHGCGYLRFSVAGARVGQAAVMTWVGTTNPPQGVMVGPLKVVATGHAVASACNVTGHKIAGSRVKVRITTLS